MAGMTPWERGRPARNTPEAWAFPRKREFASRKHGRPARFGCSRAFNAVIPAKAGIQVSRGTARPGGRRRPARIGRGDPTWQA